MEYRYRIRYVNKVILATAWYTTQNFLPLTDSVRQMNTEISWFLWKGKIFKVPLTALQLPKEDGGRTLVHIMARFMTLFILRMENQRQQTAIFTTDWLTRWHLNVRRPNPPHHHKQKGYQRNSTNFIVATLKLPTRPLRGGSENHKSHKKRL